MFSSLLRIYKGILAIAVICALGSVSLAAETPEGEDDLSQCLKAWGAHPFGKDPKFKTLSTTVKVFGIGKNQSDKEKTDAPVLIMVNPAVNVMGGTTIELLNPNGWYCFRANVNVMGGLIIKAHCKAHLAFAKDGATVMGNSDGKGVTVMGSSKVESVECEKGI